MYISWRRALQLPMDIVTYQGRQEEVALVDSSTIHNFIDTSTVKKLNLGTRKIPWPIEIYNVDGTHNQDGKVEWSVHLYIKSGEQQIKTKFFVTNLGRDRIILGYLWFEAFNPKINWREGKLLGPQISLKTTGTITREHVNEAYKIRCMAIEIRNTTIAQKMAKAFQVAKPKTDTPVPPEIPETCKSLLGTGSQTLPTKQVMGPSYPS
jgi:hypothetical protein